MPRSISLSVLAAALLFHTTPFARQESVDAATIEKITREGMDRSRVYETFTYFVDAIGPRLTASPAYKTAADWSREQLAKSGLQNARLESWEFGRGWQLDRFTLEMVEPRYMPLVGYPEGWSASMPSELVAAPIYTGGASVEALQAMRDKLKGAIVLAQPAQASFVREDRGQPTDPAYVAPPPPPQRGQGSGGRGAGRGNAPTAQQVLRDAGPAVVLRTSRGEHGTMFVLGRDQGANALPSVIVAAEHYNMIVR